MIYEDMFRMDNEGRWSQLKFVTSNADKVREASKILGCPLEQVSTLMIHEIQTHDINKIVEHKAQQAYKELKCPVLVEDSGLIFKAWNGLPGALVKWFEIGVERLVLGSLIVTNPNLVKEAIKKYPGRIVLGIDLINDKLAIEG